MSNLVIDEKTFGDKLYSRFPLKYREDDVIQNNTLLRYFQALNEGGYALAITDLNGLLDLLDYSKAEKSILPIILKHYGVNSDGIEEVPAIYQRRLYKVLGELVSSRGTLNTFKYAIEQILNLDALGTNPFDSNTFSPGIYVSVIDLLVRIPRNSSYIIYPKTASSICGGPFLISVSMQSVEEIGDFEDALEFSKATRNLIHQFLPYIFKDEYRIIYRYKEDKKVLSADKQSTVIYKKLTQMSSTTINGVTFYPYEVNGILYYIEDSSEPLHLRNKFRGTI